MYRGAFIKNPNTMESVFHDGTTIGEFMIKGSIVIDGYFNNVEAIAKAFEKQDAITTGNVPFRLLSEVSATSTRKMTF